MAESRSLSLSSFSEEEEDDVVVVLVGGRMRHIPVSSSPIFWIKASPMRTAFPRGRFCFLGLFVVAVVVVVVCVVSFVSSSCFVLFIFLDVLSFFMGG